MIEEEYEKKVKGTKTFCIIVGILFLIGFIIGISQKNIINSVLSIGFIILLYLFYVFTKKKKIAGPILGIILGTLYILQLNILSIIIGVFIISDCLKIMKYIKGINNKEEISLKNNTFMKKIVIFILVIVIVCVLIFIGFLGTKIMNEAVNVNSNIDHQSNNSNYYCVNEITFTYGNDWTEVNIEEQGKTNAVLQHKTDNIFFSCSEAQEIMEYDYTQESERQFVYNVLRAGYMYYGKKLTKESGSFTLINNNLYCACFEVDVGSLYNRFYILVNLQKNKACVCITASENALTSSQESKVMDIIQTIKF